jgi:hypothetical protein
MRNEEPPTTLTPRTIFIFSVRAVRVVRVPIPAPHAARGYAGAWDRPLTRGRGICAGFWYRGLGRAV